MTIPTHNGIIGMVCKDRKRGLGPSLLLEGEIKRAEEALDSVPHWLGFGGLYGLVYNNGIIPDADLDYCTYYGMDYKRIKQQFEAQGYTCTKVLLNDINRSKALYMGFNRPVDKKCLLPENRLENHQCHICLSFWYPANGMLWFCHDSSGEVSGEAVPPYYEFKGVPENILHKDDIIKVEYPGIPGNVKVSVPLMAGALLDYCYIGSPFKAQKYNVKNYEIQEDKLAPLFSGGAISRYACKLKSIAQFEDKAYMNGQLKESQKKWDIKRRQTIRRN